MCRVARGCSLIVVSTPFASRELMIRMRSTMLCARHLSHFHTFCTAAGTSLATGVYGKLNDVLEMFIRSASFLLIQGRDSTLSSPQICRDRHAQLTSGLGRASREHAEVKRLCPGRLTSWLSIHRVDLKQASLSSVQRFQGPRIL